MIYGHDKTIHRNGYIDVEVDANGDVVSVWFRCLQLPFRAHRVDAQRAAERRASYHAETPAAPEAVHVAEPTEPDKAPG